MTYNDSNQSQGDTDDHPISSEITPGKARIAVEQGVSKMEINRSYGGKLKFATSVDSIHFRLFIDEPESEVSACASMEMSEKEFIEFYEELSEVVECLD